MIRFQGHDDLEITRAAVADGPEAIAAWERYIARQGAIERIQGDAYALLPLVYRNLQSHSYTGADLGRLKGIYRRTWYRNSLLLRGSAAASARLGACGIESMRIGRGALLSMHPGEVGTRAMDAVDLLVAAAGDAQAAVALTAEGWRETGEGSRHVARLEGPADSVLDLHDFAVLPARSRHRRHAHTAAVWAGAVHAASDGTDVRILSPADQLLEICALGFGSAPARPGWVVDAMLILQKDSGRMNWGELVERAQACGITLRLVDALGFLVAELGLELPAGAAQPLREAQATAGERVLHRIARSRARQRVGA